MKVAQLCLTLWDPMDYTVHGILQAKILEWITFPLSRGSSQTRDQTQVTHIAGRSFTSWATREAQEYWIRQPIPSPADLLDPGIELGSPALQADSLPTELLGKPIKRVSQVEMPEIEPGASCTLSMCSATELYPPDLRSLRTIKGGWNWTGED